ncbi:hypothetical protein PAHAL_2G395300 [Panicum hallii]|uniref:PGG domain-containing protein n=3 Tax=Panicum hallii TaxID=206008 RepID=A0A2T8KS28_9POAL|nr:hypothetical protein PAHAL_2G395300 [Panicum hallii]
MTASPELASVTNDDGVSVLYLAVTLESRRMVRALLRRSPDGAPSPASFTGPEGRTAMHVAAACCKEVVMDILAWKPEGPTLLTKVDSSGKSPLHFAVLHYNLDAVELLLNVEASLVRISDKDGLYPLHAAAMVGSTRIIDELITKCHDYYEMVDDKGRNFLHCAVEHARDKVVDHICRNDKFDMLLNATDDEGNTPLHLAVKHGHPRIVTLLLQTMSVKTCIINKNGLTVLDLAHEEVLSGSNYFLDPHMIVFNCLCSSEPNLYTVEGIQLLRVKDRPATETEASMKEDGMTKTGTIASVLIATVAFAAAFTVPGGFIADDHPNAGTAILARKFAFRAFVVSDTMAFVCSIVATSFHIYGGAWEIPPNHRSRYNRLASGLVPVGVQFMVAAFAFGLHLVLGAADLGLIILVYIVSSASVLFCFPSIWVPLHLGVGKAIWRRAGWRGLADMHYSPSNLRDLFDCFIYSFLFQNIRRPFFAVLICAMFIVAIVLEITLPNY